MSTIVSTDFAEIKIWMQEKGLAHYDEVIDTCTIKGCNNFIREPHGADGWCQICYNVILCDQIDDAHNNALLYSELCRKKHDGIIICVSCAKKVQKKVLHCACPTCGYDFGPVSNYRPPYIKKYLCAVQGCGYHLGEIGRSPDVYGYCDLCENVKICSKQDKAHQAMLIYYNGCKIHTDGISVCLFCASKKCDLKPCKCPSWYVDIVLKN